MKKAAFARRARRITFGLGAVCALLSLASCSQDDMDAALLGLSPTQLVPLVLATSPENGQRGVDANGDVWVLFNQTMDPEKAQDAFRLASGSGQVFGSFRWEGQRMIFRPRESLSGVDEFTMTIGRSTESDQGVDLGDDVIVRFFITPDIARPRFLSSTPAAGAVNVAAASNIRLIFSRQIDFSTAGAGIAVSPSFLFTATQNPEKTEIILIPSNPLAPGTYTVSVNQSLLDTNGSRLQNPTSFFFTVGADFAAPAITAANIGASALNNGVLVTGAERASPIVLTFSEPMDPVSTENAVLLNPSAAVTRTWNGAGDQLTLTFTGGLDPETVYTLSVDATARDQNNNGLNTSYSFPFLTNGPNSLRPTILTSRQMNSSAPGCVTGAVATGPGVTPLVDFSAIDISQAIDLTPLAGTPTCVRQFQFTFNNALLASSVFSNVSVSTVIGVAGLTVSLADVQVAGATVRVSVGGNFPPHAVTEIPVIRLRFRGGSTGVTDLNGNTLEEDFNLYLTY